MPGFKSLAPVSVRRRDAALAAIAGILMGLLVYFTLTTGQDRSVSDFYRENSLPLAHGRNVVNVILVDFRALDTLGEITVLAVAAFGAQALMRRRRRARKAPS
jgi:multicomponent Na+:H+ antiporter subunit A